MGRKIGDWAKGDKRVAQDKEEELARNSNELLEVEDAIVEAAIIESMHDTEAVEGVAEERAAIVESMHGQEAVEGCAEERAISESFEGGTTSAGVAEVGAFDRGSSVTEGGALRKSQSVAEAQLVGNGPGVAEGRKLGKGACAAEAAVLKSTAHDQDGQGSADVEDIDWEHAETRFDGCAAQGMRGDDEQVRHGLNWSDKDRISKEGLRSSQARAALQLRLPALPGSKPSRKQQHSGALVTESLQAPPGDMPSVTTCPDAAKSRPDVLSPRNLTPCERASVDMRQQISELCDVHASGHGYTGRVESSIRGRGKAAGPGAAAGKAGVSLAQRLNDSSEAALRDAQGGLKGPTNVEIRTSGTAGVGQAPHVQEARSRVQGSADEAHLRYLQGRGDAVELAGAHHAAPHHEGFPHALAHSRHEGGAGQAPDTGEGLNVDGPSALATRTVGHTEGQLTDTGQGMCGAEALVDTGRPPGAFDRPPDVHKRGEAVQEKRLGAVDGLLQQQGPAEDDGGEELDYDALLSADPAVLQQLPPQVQAAVEAYRAAATTGDCTHSDEGFTDRATGNSEVVAQQTGPVVKVKGTAFKLAAEELTRGTFLRVLYKSRYIIV
jgi:hypothetical protein